MNALQLALDSGRNLDQVSLKNGDFYLNVIDVTDHGGVFEIKYRFRQTLVYAYVPKDQIAAVTTK